jgi:hypothetical protein
MAKVPVRLTEETFIGGCLRPAGYEELVDEDDLGAKVGATAKPGVAADPEPVALTPNLQKVARGAGDDLIDYEVAAISPTGPAPTAPQATPPGTTQPTAGSFVAPAEADGDSAGVSVVPAGAAAPAPPKRHR